MDLNKLHSPDVCIREQQVKRLWCMSQRTFITGHGKTTRKLLKQKRY